MKNIFSSSNRCGATIKMSANNASPENSQVFNLQRNASRVQLVSHEYKIEEFSGILSDEMMENPVHHSQLRKKHF